jgi:hypothetical protein
VKEVVAGASGVAEKALSAAWVGDRCWVVVAGGDRKMD